MTRACSQARPAITLMRVSDSLFHRSFAATFYSNLWRASNSLVKFYFSTFVEMPRVWSNTCLSLMSPSVTDVCATVPTTSKTTVGSRIWTGLSWARSACPCHSFLRLGAPATRLTSRSIPTRTRSPLRFPEEMIPSSTGEQHASACYTADEREIEFKLCNK